MKPFLYYKDFIASIFSIYLIYFLGFQDEGSVNEELWNKSVAKFGDENNINNSLWSGFLVFSVFFIVPYLIHKISNNIKHIQLKGTKNITIILLYLVVIVIQLFYANC